MSNNPGTATRKFREDECYIPARKGDAFLARIEHSSTDVSFKTAKYTRFYVFKVLAASKTGAIKTFGLPGKSKPKYDIGSIETWIIQANTCKNIDELCVRFSALGLTGGSLEEAEHQVNKLVADINREADRTIGDCGVQSRI